MTARNIQFPAAPLQVNHGAVGARNISAPLQANHAAVQGAVALGGAPGSRSFGGPAANPANTGARALSAAPSRSPMTPAQQRGAMPASPRPGVARRPGLAQPSGPGARALPAAPLRAPAGQQAPTVVAVAAAPAPSITPLTQDQMLFLTHLLDGFLTIQHEENNPAAAATVELAESSKDALAVWMAALGTGAAASKPLAPSTAAPAAAPAAAAPAVAPVATSDLPDRSQRPGVPAASAPAATEK